MDITGEYLIAAPRDRVWAALTDAEVLRQSMPADHDGTIALSVVEAPHACVLHSDGQQARVHLTDTGDGQTRLTFDATIDAEAEPDTRAFFAHLAGLLGGVGAPAPAAITDEAPEDTPAPAESIPLVELAPVTEIIAPTVILAAQEAARDADLAQAAGADAAETEARTIEHQLRPTEAEALGSAGISPPPEPTPEGTPAPALSPPPAHPGLRPMIWIPILVLILLLMIVLIR